MRAAADCNSPADSRHLADDGVDGAVETRGKLRQHGLALRFGVGLRRLAAGFEFAGLDHTALENIERPDHGADLVLTIDTRDIDVQVARGQPLQRLRRGADRQDETHDQRESHADAERDAHRQRGDQRRAGGGEMRLALVGGFLAASVGEGDVLVQK